MALGRQFLTLFCICSCFVCNGQASAGDTIQKRNIVSAIQFQFTENGLGFGASYERILNEKGSFSFYIPFIVTFDVANTNRIYDYNAGYYNTGTYTTGKADAMYYTMPGMKYYPAGCYGSIKYAVGLSLVVGSGQVSRNDVSANGLTVMEHIRSHFVAGGMVQNSLNINIGKQLYLGAELGLGNTFVNKEGDAMQNNEFLIQGAFKIGCRF